MSNATNSAIHSLSKVFSRFRFQGKVSQPSLLSVSCDRDSSDEGISRRQITYHSNYLPSLIMTHTVTFTLSKIKREKCDVLFQSINIEPSNAAG